MNTSIASGAAASLLSAHALLERRCAQVPVAAWSLEVIAGRFIALEPSDSGTAVLSLMAGLIREAQMQAGLVAWITEPRRLFFPPDFAAAGVDLAALPVVRAPELAQAARAADILLRSGSFALLVLDGDGQALPLALQTRLAGLAQQHHTALVCLRSPGEAASRGSLVSLRCMTYKRRVGHDCFSVGFRAAKDKQQPPGWTHQELRHGPYGLY